MNTRPDARRWRARRVTLASLLLGSGLALAQSSGGIYTAVPQRIAAGGGQSSGGAFELKGTIGQAEASAVRSGGAFELTGGFHRRAQGGPLPSGIFANGFEGS